MALNPPGKRTLRALVFDFDGLIVDTETPLIDAFAAVHRNHGQPFDRDLFIRSVGHDAYSFDPWASFGPDADRPLLELEMNEIKRALVEQQPVRAGVIPLMDLARERGLRIGLASNSTITHCRHHLTRVGLIDRFHALATRDEVSAPKPDPELYRLALTKLGVPANAALALEDSHTGSLGAHRAGLLCVVTPNPSTAHHDFSHADLVLPSLAGGAPDELLSWANTRLKPGAS